MKEDIEILENLLEEGFEAMCPVEAQAIENLLKAYKEKEIETKKDKETIAKLSYELGKYQEKSKEDEAVIEEMANEIFIEHNPHFKTTEEVKEDFRNKAKENKE